MKDLEIIQRTQDTWSTSSGDQIIKGRFYVVIDRKPSKVKLAGFENHWALENRFYFRPKQQQDKLVSLVNSFDDLQKFCATDINKDQSRYAIKQSWGLSDEAMASLYECINYIKETKEQALLAWAKT